MLGTLDTFIKTSVFLMVNFNKVESLCFFNIKKCGQE